MKKHYQSKLPIKLAKYLEEMTDLLDSAIEKSLIKEDDLREHLAFAWAEMKICEESHDELLAVLGDYEQALSIFSSEAKYRTHEGRAEFLRLFAETNNKAAIDLIKGIKLQKSSSARKSADARHNKPGGSRDKQAAIRKIWASGKYSSRDICAEQECAALGMSFSAARKALRNTPSPT